MFLFVGWEREKSTWAQRNIFNWGPSRLLCPPRLQRSATQSLPKWLFSIQAKLNMLRARLDSIQPVTVPFPAPTPDFIIYDRVSLNETISKSSFLFHTDNIIFIKLIFQEALFYSDFPEPGEIILFLPLGLKENLSITNVYQQHNFFGKKLKSPWHSRERNTRLGWWTPREAFWKGKSLSKSSVLCVSSWAVCSESSQEWFQNR